MQPRPRLQNSNLAVLWFTCELQRRLPPDAITANAVCPGFVPTTAAASISGAMCWLMTHLLPHMPFATRADAAADSFVFMALRPVTGRG